jgi:hypothetical protein
MKFSWVHSDDTLDHIGYDVDEHGGKVKLHDEHNERKLFWDVLYTEDSALRWVNAFRVGFWTWPLQVVRAVGRGRVRHGCG